MAMVDIPLDGGGGCHDGKLDVRAAERAWDAALRAPSWEDPPVWFHGDLLAGNLLVNHGRLSAVIDWGCLGAGDPACDMLPAWSCLSVGTRDVFRNELDVDDGTWVRGRGWALYVALVGLVYYENTNPGFVRVLALLQRYLESTNLTPNAAGEARRLTRVHSHELRDEQRSGRLPPSPPPFVPFHASHLLEHPYEVLVTGIDSTLDEQPAAPHRLVEMRNQFASLVPIEPVGIRHESETSRAIEVIEPEAAGALIVIDRDAHPCECSEVEDGSAWSGKVEIK